jgi:hypothetical protein
MPGSANVLVGMGVEGRREEREEADEDVGAPGTSVLPGVGVYSGIM